MKSILFYILVFFSLQNAFSQTCSQRLNRAEDDYEAGRLLVVPGVILELLEKDEQDKTCLSKEEEIRARKLLTKTYIFTDDELKAERALIALLKADPEHQLDEQTDPRELFYLMGKFRKEPILRISARVGLNTSSVNVIETYSTSPTTGAEAIPKFYNGINRSGADSFTDENGRSYDALSGRGFGFSGELSLERHVKKGVEVSLGAQYRVSRYNVDSYIGNDPDGNLVTSLTNKQIYVRVPVLVRYNIWYRDHTHLLKPYLFAGASPDFLSSASYEEASRNGGTAFNLRENGDLIENGQVNEFDVSVFLGVGLKYRISTHYLTIEFRYDRGLNNYIDSDRRNLNNGSTFDLGFVEDDLSLNTLNFVIGWSHSLYKPVKLKEYR